MARTRRDNDVFLKEMGKATHGGFISQLFQAESGFLVRDVRLAGFLRCFRLVFGRFINVLWMQNERLLPRVRDVVRYQLTLSCFVLPFVSFVRFFSKLLISFSTPYHPALTSAPSSDGQEWTTHMNEGGILLLNLRERLLDDLGVLGSSSRHGEVRVMRFGLGER